MGEAEDAVERRADFMAHIGQELGLDAAGFQSLLASQVQLDVLDLDGFQVLAHIFGGLVDAVLQFFLGVLQGIGHAVDAGCQLIQLLAAQRRQTGFQVAILELCHGLLDLADGRVDRAADAQGQGGGADQADGDQQQTGKQAAIAAQQHAIVGQLQLDPAQQAIGFIGNQLAGKVAMATEHRQQVAGGVIARALQQMGAVADGRLVEHGRAGMGQGRAVGRQEGHGAYIDLLQGLGGDAFQQIGVLVAQCRGYQWRQLLGNHLAAIEQLGLQVRELHPGEITAQKQCHQAGRQQGQQQYAAFYPHSSKHATLPLPHCCRHSTQASGPRYLRSVAI